MISNIKELQHKINKKIILTGFNNYFNYYDILKKSFKIIITGGFSKLFKNSIKTKVKQDFDITINGLIKASKLIK